MPLPIRCIGMPKDATTSVPLPKMKCSNWKSTNWRKKPIWWTPASKWKTKCRFSAPSSASNRKWICASSPKAKYRSSKFHWVMPYTWLSKTVLNRTLTNGWNYKAKAASLLPKPMPDWKPTSMYSSVFRRQVISLPTLTVTRWTNNMPVSVFLFLSWIGDVAKDAFG